MNEKKDFEATKAEIANATKAAGTMVKKGLKSALAINAYHSETDNDIGRSKAHAKHMRKTRKRNFARKMHLIDPNYGKKAAGILVAGAAAGIVATTVPGVGSMLGPTVGGATIAAGLAYLETDAHRSLGDHAILDSLLDDRGDNWRTNTTTAGFKGKADYEADSTLKDIIDSEDDEDEELDFGELLPPEYGGKNAMLSTEESQAVAAKEKKQKQLASLVGGIDISGQAHDDDCEVEDLDSILDLGSFSSRSRKPATSSPGPGYSLDKPYSQQQRAGGGGGQRFANPHSSPAVQMAGQTPSTPSSFFDLIDQTPSPASQVPKVAAAPAPQAVAAQVPQAQAAPVMAPQGVGYDSGLNVTDDLANSKMAISAKAAREAKAKAEATADPFAVLAAKQKEAILGSSGDSVSAPADVSAPAGGSEAAAPSATLGGTSFFQAAAAQIPARPMAAPAHVHVEEDDPFAELYNRPSQNSSVAADYNALHGL